MIAQRLDEAVSAVAPIEGVSIGNPADKSSWRLHFKSEATPRQRAAAEAVMAAFDQQNLPPLPPSTEERLAVLEAENQGLRKALLKKGVVSAEDFDTEKQPSRA